MEGRAVQPIEKCTPSPPHPQAEADSKGDPFNQGAARDQVVREYTPEEGRDRNPFSTGQEPLHPSQGGAPAPRATLPGGGSQGAASHLILGRRTLPW